ncbi:spermatogenesis-defective protein 39 homolog [Mya arenaria]|uniref:spermatogenesis-defective protein 39 homolog n=1 Tax=Mya arenaria TaxID=6604 RepID=UPI0022E65202|nr:spermatogenesis-defective protein 39 homolog [Mya arenaria]
MHITSNVAVSLDNRSQTSKTENNHMHITSNVAVSLDNRSQTSKTENNHMHITSNVAVSLDNRSQTSRTENNHMHITSNVAVSLDNRSQTSKTENNHMQRSSIPGQQEPSKAHFQMIPGLELDSGLIQQNIALLQRQRPVDVADDLTEKEGRHLVFRQKPRKASIINMPVITTLYYCCMYHYEEPDNLFGSPVAIRKEHQLTEKQFVWTAMRARASLHKWQDIDALFTTKGWFGGTKMKSVIGFHPVTSTLHRNGAPPEVLGKYLMLIDDVDRRLEQAHKLQCPDAVIETYQVQRNRAALEQYFHKLKPQSREWFVAGGVLKDQNIKWKA